MPPKITVTRPDGTTLDVEAAQAKKLEALGYKVQSADEAVDKAATTAYDDYYSSTKQKVFTGIEGAARGVTLGASDYLLGSNETAERARTNPGIATATEIAGAVAPELIPGLNLVAPSALVGRGARAVVRGEGLAARVGRGVLEGGAFGGAAAADHAYLAGDPVTASAVLHGIGWGSLFGAGAATVGSIVRARGMRNIASGGAQEAEAVAAAAQAKATAVPGAFTLATEPAFVTMRTEAKRLSTDIAESLKTTDAILSGNRKKMAQLGLERTMTEGDLGTVRQEVQKAYTRVSKAMNKKGFDPEKLQERIHEYEQVVGKIADKAGLSKTGSGAGALQEMAQMKVLQRELARFPASSEAFAKMNAQRAENLFASMEAAKKLSKWPTLGPQLEEAANQMQTAMGLSPNGIDGLRAAWNAGKKTVKAERVSASVPAPHSAEPSIPRKVVAAAAGYATFKAGSMTGHPFVALGAANKVRSGILNFGNPKTPELIAAHNQTIGRIKQAVGKVQVKTGNSMGVVGARISPLSLKLDGTVDTSTKDPSKLAYNRIMDFAQAAPSIKDTLFRAIEPIAVEQPELGPALHNAGIQAFQAAMGMLPSDPGVVSGLKSIWKPSSLQAAVMSRQLSVFQDPVGAAEDMLTQGIFDPIRVKALKEIAPPIYQQMKDELIMKIQEPGFLDSMNYREQVALGSLMDIPIHSSMKPEYIAASQALHFTRNQPLPTPPIQQSTNGGRPSGEGGSTAAQITTSR